MNETEEGAAQQVAPVEEEPTSTESESVPESEQEPPIPEDSLKEYEGKSAEELAKMHHGLSKKLGEQGAVIGSLKALVDEMKKGWETRTTTPNPFQPSPEATTQVAPPQESAVKLDDDSYLTVGDLKKMREEEQKYNQTRYQSELTYKTTTAFDRGMASMKDNPRLYEGIEQEVAQRVANGYMMPYKMGIDVSPELENPDRWREAAIYVRAQRNELDRITPAKMNPMKPVQTEVPSSGSLSGSELPPADINMQDQDMVTFLDTMEDATGKKPTKKEVDETIKRGAEVWHGDVSLSEINRGNR